MNKCFSLVTMLALVASPAIVGAQSASQQVEVTCSDGRIVSAEILADGQVVVPNCGTEDVLVELTLPKPVPVVAAVPAPPQTPLLGVGLAISGGVMTVGKRAVAVGSLQLDATVRLTADWRALFLGGFDISGKVFRSSRFMFALWGGLGAVRTWNWGRVGFGIDWAGYRSTSWTQAGTGPGAFLLMDLFLNKDGPVRGVWRFWVEPGVLLHRVSGQSRADFRFKVLMGPGFVY